MAQTRRQKIQNEVLQVFMIAVGAVIAAIGLELFLVPNDILDGGLIGLSIIGAALTN